MSEPVIPTVLCSETLRAHGFAHGFSTRLGGVSEGPFASMNLGAAVGDDPERVRENHRRLAARVGYDPARLHQTSQVHGAAVWCPEADATPEQSRAVDADALVARHVGMAVAVRVADCVPVLLASPVTGHVAAVHAGWRGVAQGILAEALRELDETPRRVVAAVGPSIGPCCFEVGEEVAEAIAAASHPSVVLRAPGEKPKVDLWRAVEHQLEGLGVRTVDSMRRCTRCDAERFYSFRRDGQRSGRLLGVIVAREG
jgi:YfiH family protein